jgi:hypothetical protein
MDFQGSLKEFQVPDIIQFLSGARKTGALRLMEGEERGEIFLEKGRIVHAVLGDQAGEEAVYELVLWNQGEFLFEPGVTSEKSTVSKGNTTS